MRHIFSRKLSSAERLQAAVVKTCSPQQYIPLTDNKCTESAKLSPFLFIPPSFSLPLGPELLHLVSKLRMCFLGTVLRRSHAVFTTPLAREEKARPGLARRPQTRSHTKPAEPDRVSPPSRSPLFFPPIILTPSHSASLPPTFAVPPPIPLSSPSHHLYCFFPSALPPSSPSSLISLPAPSSPPLSPLVCFSSSALPPCM